MQNVIKKVSVGIVGLHVESRVQAKEGPVQPADIQLRIDAPPADTSVEVMCSDIFSFLIHPLKTNIYKQTNKC